MLPIATQIKKTGTFFKGTCRKAWAGANRIAQEKGNKNELTTNQLPLENLVPVVRLLRAGYPQQTKTNHHHKSCTFGTPVIQKLKLKRLIRLPAVSALLGLTV